MTFSSGGYGTPSYLHRPEMFKLKIGARATHVPYQQFPQAIGDLLADVNQYMFITMLPVVDLIAAGKLRALAVTREKLANLMHFHGGRPDQRNLYRGGFAAASRQRLSSRRLR